MKRIIFCVSLLIVSGCASQEPIRNILRDQQFSSYKEHLDQLERDYLQKKITYAEYLDQKKRVEEEYQKEIDDRRDLIQNQRPSAAPNEMLP